MANNKPHRIPKVLIFIVSYHAEEFIENVLDRIPEEIWKGEKYHTEVLIIDDCSPDKTFQKAEGYSRKNKKSNLTVLYNPVNQGYGGNQKIGYHYAIQNNFDVVVLLHGDGQYAPEHLCQMINPILKGEADAVFGSRMIHKWKALKGKMPFYKWIGTISYITYGRQSYLFAFLWKYMPFFSSLRVWGRLNIILVPIIGWLLATAYTHFEDIVLRDKREWSKWKAISVLVGVYLIVLGVQSYLFRNKLYDIYWTTHFKWIEILRQASKAMADNPSCTTYLDQIAVYSKWLSFQEALFIIFGIVAFSILFVLFLCASRLQSSRSQKALLAGLVLFSMLEMGHTGILMWPGRVLSTQRTRLNIEELNQKSFGIPRTDYNATISLSESFSVGVVPNWYFNRYNQFLHSPKFDPEARKRLLGVIDGRKLYLSEAINYPAIQAFLDDAERFKDFKQVVSYTGEELILDVDAPMKGYLSFIDNWNPDWKATVDGRPVSIELLFGTFKSIQVPVGKHRVVFTYRPKFL